MNDRGDAEPDEESPVPPSQHPLLARRREMDPEERWRLAAIGLGYGAIAAAAWRAFAFHAGYVALYHQAGETPQSLPVNVLLLLGPWTRFAFLLALGGLGLWISRRSWPPRRRAALIGACLVATLVVDGLIAQALGVPGS